MNELRHAEEKIEAQRLQLEKMKKLLIEARRLLSSCRPTDWDEDCPGHSPNEIEDAKFLINKIEQLKLEK